MKSPANPIIDFLIKKGFSILAWVIIGTLCAFPAIAQESVITLLLTSNLNGRFSVPLENQETEDPLLIMAQGLRDFEKTHPVDLYLDLGNAFYPGILSRFSYGSVMMDFLYYFDCAAKLVSTMDLNIGVNNLEFLGRSKRTQLVSANIQKYDKPIFSPYFIKIIQGKPYAFVGLSSDKGFFDIAEKKILDVTITDVEAALTQALEEIGHAHVDDIILLSGRGYSENLKIMEKFKQISLCIGGGDASGELFASKAQRVDMDDGRSLVTLTNPDGFYILTLAATVKLNVKEFVCVIPSTRPLQDKTYFDFVKRLTIWKERFAQEGDVDIIQETCCEVDVDDLRAAQLLRHRFHAEIAILDKKSIHPTRISGRLTYSDILNMVNNEFPIFTYKIVGSDLKSLIQDPGNLIIAGAEDCFVQGYPIENQRSYLICSPQSVYDQLVKRFNKDIAYINTWKTLSDEIKADLQTERAIGYADYKYLDDRFRILVDIYLSNFYDHSSVSKDEGIHIPPGKPAETYEKWGLEDKIDISVYNQFHKFMVTPYIYYIRQDENYFQNLLRGTFFYTYNLNPSLKPYHKSQMDTVVEVQDSQRPVLFRETFGVLFETTYITGKAGLGFEKQTQNPEKPLFSGIETIISAKYDFLDNLSYALNLDNFYSFKRLDFNKRQIRTEITNSISFKVNPFIAFSTKHKWFYFHTHDNDENYRNAQILLCLDLMTDFKIF